MRGFFEALNTPRALLGALVLLVAINGSIYLLSHEPLPSSSPLSAGTERTNSATTAVEETNLVDTANADQIVGTSGNDTIEGRAGEDALHGGPGNDKLFGNADADELYAGSSSSGGDELFGGEGADYLNADNQEGGDTLNGGSGDDDCDGDLTEDTFVRCEERE